MDVLDFFCFLHVVQVEYVLNFFVSKVRVVKDIFIFCIEEMDVLDFFPTTVSVAAIVFFLIFFSSGVYVGVFLHS